MHISGPTGDFLQKRARDRMQRAGGFFGRLRHGQAQRPRQAQRAGHKRQTGTHESEQFQHVVQKNIGARTQPACHKCRMRHQHIAALEQRAGIMQSDALGFTVGARDRGAGWGGNKGDQGGKGIHRRAILKRGCAKA